MNILNTFLNHICIETTHNTGYVFCVQKQPIADNQSWTPLPERQLNTSLKRATGHFSAYISTQISTADNEGVFRNRKNNFHALNMVILDDVGTKVPVPDLKPTYIIESSEGNFQYGYVFKEPVTDFTLATQIIKTVYGSGVTDRGGSLTGKYVRLPVGINNKLRGGQVDDFPVSLVELNDVYFTPEDLLSGLELTLDSSIIVNSNTIKHVNLTERADSYLGLLRDNDAEFNDDGSEWVTITCPWHETHTDGVTATYSPLDRHSAGRSFKCFHDHCADKTTKDFINYLNAKHKVETIGEAINNCTIGEELINKILPRFKGTLSAIDVEINAQKAKKRYAELEDIRLGIDVFRGALKDNNTQISEFEIQCKGLAYIEYDDMVFNPKNGKLLSPTAFNRSMAKYAEDDNTPINTAMSNDYIPCYYQGVYVPWYGKEFTDNGIDYINTYRPYAIPQTRNPQAVEVFQEHLINVVPDERLRHLFINFFGYVLKSKGRIRWALLLQGSEGDGKGYFYDTMQKILGPNARTVSNSEVNSQFNDWAEGYQFTNLNEIKMAGANRDLVANSLKAVVSDDIISIHGKGVRGRECINTASYFITTNYRDIFNLDASWRRYLYIFNENGQKDKNYYDRLFEVTKTGLLDIKEFLVNYPVHADFNPEGRAPESKYFDEAVRDMQNPIDKIIDEETADPTNLLINADFVCVGGIKNAYETANKEIIHSNKITSRLHRIGYHYIERVWYNGDKLSVWSKKSIDVEYIKNYLEVNKKYSNVHILTDVVAKKS